MLAEADTVVLDDPDDAYESALLLSPLEDVVELVDEAEVEPSALDSILANELADGAGAELEPSVSVPVVLPYSLELIDDAEAELSVTDPDVLLISLERLEETTVVSALDSVELVYSLDPVDEVEAELSMMDSEVLSVSLELLEDVTAELKPSDPDVLS